MLHIVKLLVECQCIIIHVKVRMYNYCFIRVSDYMLVFVMVFVSSFGRVVWGMMWPAIGGYYVYVLWVCVSLILCRFSLTFQL